MKELMFETIINSKRYVHNNHIAFDVNQEGVSGNKVKEISKCLKDYAKVVEDKYGYKVKVGKFGLEVSSGEDSKAYLSYDESVEGNIRLNLSTSTFLGLHLVKVSAGKSINKVEVSNGTSVEKEITTRVEIAEDKEEFVEEGWVGDTFKEFNGEVNSKIEQLVLRMNEGKKNLDGEDFGGKLNSLRKELQDLYKEDSNLWLTKTEFKKGTPEYIKVKDTLEAVSKYIPKGSVIEKEKSVILVKEGFGNVLEVRCFNAERGGDGEKVSIDKTLPFYVGYKKVMNILASNLGYRKLLVGELVEEDKGKEDVVVEEEVEEESKITISDTKEDHDYYDFYIKQAGKWASKGKVFIKEQVQDIVDGEDSFTGVSILVKEDGNIYIDWTVDLETVTMALTTNPREMAKLKEDFDLQVAYDSNYEGLVKGLMLNELEENGYMN